MWLKSLGVVAGVVGAALGAVGPARPAALTGVYTMTITDGAGIIRAGSAHTWLLTPCGSDCLTVNDTRIGWIRDARLEGNSWVWTVNDGRSTYSFDQRSLEGTLAGSSATVWWVLTKND